MPPIRLTNLLLGLYLYSRFKTHIHSRLPCTNVHTYFSRIVFTWTSQRCQSHWYPKVRRF